MQILKSSCLQPSKQESQNESEKPDFRTPEQILRERKDAEKARLILIGIKLSLGLEPKSGR